MAGHGNDPLNQSHYDEVTLQEYVLGQLLPDQAEAVRQHLAGCAACRAQATDIQAFCRTLSINIDRTLEKTGAAELSFDKIAAEWRKPPRRVRLWYRARQLIPGATTVVLIVLLFAALVMLPSGDSRALRGLDLIDDYHGPQAVVAAVTDEGLVVIRLPGSEPEIITYLNYVNDPHNLVFSPDGRWLAFQDERTLHVIETRRSGLYVELELSGAADWSWSPAGDGLAYTDGSGQLSVLDPDAQTNRVIVPAGESAWGLPVWTANGQQIAYTTIDPLPSTDTTAARQAIWRVDPASGYRVELAQNAEPEQTLLSPAAWIDSDHALLVWDVQAGIMGQPSALYRLDVGAHQLDALGVTSLAFGSRLTWPVSQQGVAVAVEDERLVSLDFKEPSTQTLDPLPWPLMLEWAPNGAWLAYTVPGALEGEGLFLYALSEQELEAVELPTGATEEAVSWAGPEHLFVIRQPAGRSVSELWLVSLTTDTPPQRILTNVWLPESGHYNGWQWHDVLAMQVLP